MNAVAVFVPSYCVQHRNPELLTTMSKIAAYTAVDVAKDKNVQYLVFSTAYDTWQKEAELKINIAKKAGVDEKVIKIIPAITSTATETSALKQILGDEVDRLIVVADKFHAPRLELHLKHLFPSLEINMRTFSTSRYETMMEPSLIKRLRSGNKILWILWNYLIYVQMRCFASR